MSWVDRELQKNILEYLYEKYGNSCISETIFEEICIKSSNQTLPKNNNPIILVDENTNFEEIDRLEDIFNKNLIYLIEHQLINMERNISTFDSYKNYLVSISHKGIDFLEQDGGLSAILDVVTVKLHTDTIRELIAAKIDAADMPENEKNALKETLSQIKDAAIGKLTEKAIEQIPFAMLLALI